MEMMIVAAACGHALPNLTIRDARIHDVFSVLDPSPERLARVIANMRFPSSECIQHKAAALHKLVAFIDKVCNKLPDLIDRTGILVNAHPPEIPCAIPGTIERCCSRFRSALEVRHDGDRVRHLLSCGAQRCSREWRFFGAPFTGSMPDKTDRSQTTAEIQKSVFHRTTMW